MGDRLPRWLDGPGAPERISVLLLVGVALLAALVRYPTALAELGDLAEKNAALSYTDREIAGGNAVIPDQELMYQARARIAEDETYEVVVGEPLESWPDFTVDHAAGYAQYFLIPRRRAVGAPWLLCFNCPLGNYPGDVVWQNEDEGVALVRRG